MGRERNNSWGDKNEKIKLVKVDGNEEISIEETSTDQTCINQHLLTMFDIIDKESLNQIAIISMRILEL